MVRPTRLDITPAQRISRFAIRSFARWLAWRGCEVSVSGLEHLPRRGPVLIAARHYHHLYDAVALLGGLPRPLHFLVALDWTHSGRERWLLETACRLAVWPGLIRPPGIDVAAVGPEASHSAAEARAYTRRALRQSVDVLLAGRALVVFPEGSPVIDPERPERPGDSLLPFQAGFVTTARLVARALGRPAPVVPVGFQYGRSGQRWHAHLRIGAPLFVGPDDERTAVVANVERAVRRLSGLTEQSER